MSDQFTSEDVAAAQSTALEMAAAACDGHAEQKTLAIFASAPNKALVVWHLALLVPRLARAVAFGVGVEADIAGALEHMAAATGAADQSQQQIH